MGWSESIADMLRDRGRGCYYSTNMVQWRNDDGSFYRIYDRLDRDEYSVLVDGVKLERAVEMTLGRGECRNTMDDQDFMCSECGRVCDNGGILRFEYCPFCGRKVKP